MIIIGSCAARLWSGLRGWCDMYIPRHHHYLFSVALILFGFWIKQKFGNTLDVWFTAFYLQFIGLMHGYYIMQAGIMYQGYMTAMNMPDPKPVIQDTPAKEMPPVKFGEWQTVNQVVQPVRFDMERQFAKTLLIMRDYKPNDEAVDLREETWKRPNKFKTREAYVSVRDKWEGRGILGRKSAAKNARYIVKRWDAVELVAAGNPLPH